MLLFFVATGCQGIGVDVDKPSASDFNDPEQARSWANLGSAYAVFAPIYVGISDVVSADPEAACPAWSSVGSTVTLTGDCVDDDGVEWFGTIEVTDDPGRHVVRWDGFDRIDPGEQVSLTTGDAFLDQADGSEPRAFEATFERTGRDVAVRYEGVVTTRPEGVGDGWNGSGEIERIGASELGVVSATTVEQVRNSQVCEYESLSGRSTFVQDEHELEVVYDGANDCDPESTVRWFVDGVDLGELDGVSCATGRGGFAGIWIVLLGLGRRMHRQRS